MDIIDWILLAIFGGVVIAVYQKVVRKTPPNLQEDRIFPENVTAECTDEDRRKACKVLADLERDDVLTKSADDLRAALREVFKESRLPACITVDQITEHPLGAVWLLRALERTQPTDA